MSDEGLILMMIIFCKAIIGLFAYDLVLMRYDFARLHRIVHNWKVPRKDVRPEVIFQVSDAVNRACIWYPKRALCLQRSVVTACLLRSCGVEAHFVMGAQMIPFRAHAWVEVAGRAINEPTDVQAIYGVWERC
jgi:hypothetical protein